MRFADRDWEMKESGAEASRVERLEAELEALNRKLGRLERRQQRFADMIRLLLELHDRTTARMAAVDDDESSESHEELSAAVGEITRTVSQAPMSVPPRARRGMTRRKDV
jgi:predicted nuclease with TOPRIM domain